LYITQILEGFEDFSSKRNFHKIDPVHQCH